MGGGGTRALLDGRGRGRGQGPAGRDVGRAGRSQGPSGRDAGWAGRSQGPSGRDAGWAGGARALLDGWGRGQGPAGWAGAGPGSCWATAHFYRPMADVGLQPPPVLCTATVDPECVLARATSSHQHKHRTQPRTDSGNPGLEPPPLLCVAWTVLGAHWPELPPPISAKPHESVTWDPEAQDKNPRDLKVVFMCQRSCARTLTLSRGAWSWTRP